MKINRKNRSGKQSVDEYIEELENELLKKESSAIHKFILSANEVATVFAEDLALLAKGRIDECKLLSGDKDDKSVERIFLVLKNNELFSEIYKTSEGLIPEIVDEVLDAKVVFKDDESTFETMRKRVKNGRGE